MLTSEAVKVDSRLTSEAVKRAAREFGADLVGIGSIDRWENAPYENHPRAIMPRARSVICIGFRIPRGSFRGVEEGTYYSSYTLTGFSDINNYLAPGVQRKLANFIEDYGYEASTVMYNSGRLTTPPGKPALNRDGTEKPRPDVFINFRIAGVLCGVGQIGLSRVLLTPEFGPAQRIFLLVTEAPLEPDPLLQEPLCDGCRECVRQCPGKAIDATEKDDVDIPGVTYIKRFKLDDAKCALIHGSGALSPFASDEVNAYAQNIIDGSKTHTADGQLRPGREEIVKNVNNKVGYAVNAQNYFHSPAGLCAGMGCMRACLAHLEKRGRLKRKFHEPFRE